ncbi:MAG: VOC family protein [Saprospiraceae bacterium]
MNYFVSGIQQIGLGNSNLYETWEWYRKNLGMDVPIFDEAAEAKLMLPYTNNEVRSRHAVLALNLAGGGGMEIWQYTSRTPEKANFEIGMNDLGILCSKFKTPNIAELFQSFKTNKVKIVSEIDDKPFGKLHFFAMDLFDNLIEIVEEDNYFELGNKICGGVSGASLGVENMEESILLFKNLLGYDLIIGDQSGTFDDLQSINGGKENFRRVLLTHSEQRKGPFSELLGKTTIELICCTSKKGNRIFEHRNWGDLGYIHLCFDIVGLDELKNKSAELGYPFTVDSNNSFDMGEAAGRFSYIETKEGILLEFVETHKIPILKKLGWFLNLKNRNREKALPRYLLKGLGLNRKKKPVYPRS